MGRWLRDHSLSVTLLLLFIFILFGQSVTGHRQYNSDQREHHQSAITYWHYLGTGNFTEITFENWESEFLQMGSYVLLTVFLFQRGSKESKDPDKDGPEDTEPRRAAPGYAAAEGYEKVPWPVRRGGIVLKLYENSLLVAFMALFLMSFFLHAWGGARDFSQQQLEHGEHAVSMLRFMTTAEFWNQSLQNWQSEFFSIFAMVVLSIFLRQKGSPESKPVAAPHSKTGD